VRAKLSDDQSKEAASWNAARNVALIAAIASLLGTVIGGAITYFTNRALQEQQVSEQQARQAAQTRVAARLLFERYARIDEAVIAMFCSRSLFHVDEPPSLTDEELVVGRASAAGLQTLNNADIRVALLLRTLKSRSVRQGVAAGGYGEAFVYVDQGLRRALAVVTPMSGFAEHYAPVLHQGGVDQAACR
jgi:hypothetical protein